MRFAIVTRDELWEGGRLREERLSWGQATDEGETIVATDTPDEELFAAVPSPRAAERRWREAPDEGRLRFVTSARRCGDQITTETTIIVTINNLSIATTSEHLGPDTDLLLKLASRKPQRAIDDRGLPILWKNGSGAVLLHEAAGHPAEHQKETVEWPEWLSVTDEPSFEIDDAGRPTGAVDLLRGERPSALRRASFTDVPLPRLSAVVVRQNGAPFDLPDPRIDIELVGGGRYDALTDMVIVDVSAADLIENGQNMAISPFTIVESRKAIARAIRGASGRPQRYPGVICSSEGQEIAVGSVAPLLLTIS